jgi:hypothetical protein
MGGIMNGTSMPVDDPHEGFVCFSWRKRIAGGNVEMI